MNKVTLCKNTLEPSTWTTHEDVSDVRDFLIEHFGIWPATAHIFLDHVAKNSDITPHDDAGIERLGKLSNSNIFVVVYPEGIELILIVVSLVVAAVAIGLSFLLRPGVPKPGSTTASSANNHLSDRQNKARPNERIPDIFGQLWATFDLLTIPYRTFVNNLEIEHTFMCIGRGSYDILQVRDDVTDFAEIDGASAEVYGPYDSPNALAPAPILTIGPPIGELVVNLQTFDAVNGQIVSAPNVNSVRGQNNIRFEFDNTTHIGTIRNNGSPAGFDFTDHFQAGDTVQIGGLDPNDDLATDPGGFGAVHLGGAYLATTVTAHTITLTNPQVVNASWTSVAGFSGGVSTYYSNNLIANGTFFVGPLTVINSEITEIWMNFVCPQGLYKIYTDGNQYSSFVDIDVTVTPCDPIGNPVGSPTTQTLHIDGSHTDQQQKGGTLKFVLPVGANALGGVLVQAQRTSSEDHASYVQQNVSQTQWRDCYLVSPVSQLDFGNVTTIQTLVNPTPSALAIKERKLNALVTRHVTRLVGGPTTGVLDDLLDWWLLANRTTQHLEGTLHSYSWLDADGLKFWRIKDPSGHPWDINLYDNNNIYLWITENGDEMDFADPNSWKRNNRVNLTGLPQGWPLWPRFFDTTGGSVFIDVPAPNPVIRTDKACETDGEPVIQLGHVRGQTDAPIFVNFGGTVGNQLCIVCTYYYGGTGSTYNNREQFYLVKGLGVVQWIFSTFNTGTHSWTIVQSSLNNLIIAGGSPTPVAPCAATVTAWLGGVPGAGGNILGLPGGTPGTMSGSKNAADIICAMALDPFIGNRTIDEIDVAGIYAIAGPGGIIETYFSIYINPTAPTEFCYTFDDAQVSFEESLADIANAIFCVAYRRGSLLSLSFEQQTQNSVILFNHRNKIPKSETRTVTFGTLNDNDGIILDYIEPMAPNYPNLDTTTSLYFPPNKTAVNPKKVTAIGIRNVQQATILGWRLYKKLVSQNISVQFDSTEEAALLVLQDRILVADNTRSDTQDGDVLVQAALLLTLSQDVVFNVLYNYVIFLQLSDGTVESISITPGPLSNQVMLANAPSLPLVVDDAMYAKTTYMIVNDSPVRSNAFLLAEKNPKDAKTYEVKAVNYDDSYYDHDMDFNSNVDIAGLIVEVVQPSPGPHVDIAGLIIEVVTQ